MNELRLWIFDEAPQEYKNLSEAGGDEDWLLFVPERLEEDPLIYSLVESKGFDKMCAPEEHEVDGGTVFIGCHA